MSEINMQSFPNMLREFTKGKEDKDSFIQKALKVCKVFKVKPLKAPGLDVPSKKTACNLFCKDIRKIKKELQGVPVSKTSAIIPKEWKKVKTVTKRSNSTESFTKKRNDEMKRTCRGTKKIIWMKWRLLTSTKGVARRSEGLHSLEKHQIQMNQARKNRGLKKLKKNHSPKKHQKPQGLLIQARMTQVPKKNRGQKRSLQR